jgi:hypothetical protein
MLGHRKAILPKKAPLFRSIGKGRMHREPPDRPAAFGILRIKRAGRRLQALGARSSTVHRAGFAGLLNQQQ